MAAECAYHNISGDSEGHVGAPSGDLDVAADAAVVFEEDSREARCPGGAGPARPVLFPDRKFGCRGAPRADCRDNANLWTNSSRPRLMCFSSDCPAVFARPMFRLRIHRREPM